MGQRMKILICNATNFIMANYIRYVLYRSKDYRFVSVDNLDNLDDSKRIYYNKLNRFYIGNCNDALFMSKITHLEKPEAVVSTKDNRIYLDIAANTHVTIGMPNVFGMRQKDGFPDIIRQYLYNDKIQASNMRVPWAYAEDVASYLWYIIHNLDGTDNVNLHYNMPPTGYATEVEFARNVFKVFGENKDIEICKKELILDYKWTKTDWVQDIDFWSAVTKTIKWYKANKWAL